jgi:hypothetical protein
MIEPMIITVTAMALTQARFDRPSLGASDRVRSPGQAMPCRVSCGRRIDEPAPNGHSLLASTQKLSAVEFDADAGAYAVIHCSEVYSWLCLPK